MKGKTGSGLKTEKSVVFHPSVNAMETLGEEEVFDPLKDKEKENGHYNYPQSAKFVLGASEEEMDDQFITDIRGEEVSYVVRPPDGGWGWVVVAASFICNVIVDGIIFSCGTLLPALQKEFECTQFEIMWISSFLGGFYLMVGPFVSGLANAYGFRTVCILGSIIASLSFGLSYFATSHYFLYVSFGVFGGTGFGLIYVPAVIATGFYFEKKRALATGIAVCGSGIGTFIFAPLNNSLVVSIGWRLTLVVYAGIILICGVCGLAFRPLQPTAVHPSAGDYEVSPPRTPLLQRIKKARDQQMRECASALSMASQTSRSPSNYEDCPGVNFNGDTKNGGVNVAKSLMERHGAGSKRYSFPSVNLPGPEIPEETETPLIENAEAKETTDKTEHVLDNNKNETSMKYRMDAPENEPMGMKRKTPRIMSAPSIAKEPYTLDFTRRRSMAAVKMATSRPFYREDIFYSGSLARIPQYNSSRRTSVISENQQIMETMDKYHESVTQLPPMEDIIEEEEEGQKRVCLCFPKSFSTILGKMFDFSLLRSATFVILAFAGSLSLLALFVPFMFLPAYAQTVGVDKGSQATLVSTIGFVNTVGRIFCGWVSDHPKVDALFVNNISLLIGGLATIALPFMSDESLLLAYSVAFGMSVAAFASLRSILLVELLGLERLTNAFGLLLLFQGIAATFGSPIAGAFYDITKTYDVSFWLFGGIFALSGAMCIPLRCIKRWEENRLEKNEEKA